MPALTMSQNEAKLSECEIEYCIFFNYLTTQLKGLLDSKFGLCEDISCATHSA